MQSATDASYKLLDEIPRTQRQPATRPLAVPLRQSLLDFAAQRHLSLR